MCVLYIDISVYMYIYPTLQVERHYPDGRKDILFPDASRKIVYPNGVQVCCVVYICMRSNSMCIYL